MMSASKYRPITIGLVALTLLAAALVVMAPTLVFAGRTRINHQVISSGGGSTRSDCFGMRGTASQTATGEGHSESFALSHGFWSQALGSGVNCIPGDADGSSNVDIDDVVYLIAYIFSGGPEPRPYESGDANCSGGVDIDDVVWLINYIFFGGNAPCDLNGDGSEDC